MKKATQHALIDQLIESKNLRNDSHLADALGMLAPQISKTRNGKIPVTDSMRVAIQRKFKWSLKRIDDLAPPNAAAE